MARRSFAFSYDDLGRLTSSAPTLNTMTKATDNYGYDPTSRVTSGPVTGTTGNPNYSYSETGAITQATTHFATAAYAPNGQLCWTSPTSTSSPSCGSPPASATTFNYDLNGNRTSSTSPLSSTSLSWQSTSGRLVCVNTAGTTCSTSSPSATTTLYSYDGEGLRTASSNNGVTNAFIWDTGASQLLADSTHDYVYLQGSVTPDLQINLTTGTVDLLIQDQNANTRGVVQVTGTNSTFDGTIVNYTDYDAYGNAITQSGGSINPGGMSNEGVSTDISTSFAFGAGYWDASNLTYLVHRYLDNETGQFISVDPLVDQTREAYVYAGDGPLMAFDASGLWWCLPERTSGPCGKSFTHKAPFNMHKPIPAGARIFKKSTMLKGDVKMDFWVLELKNHSLRYIKRNGTTFNFKQPGRSIGANIRSCAEGGFTALINEEQQIAAFGVVLVAMDSIPVVGEFAISAEAAGTALNVAYGCVTSIASDNM